MVPKTSQSPHQHHQLIPGCHWNSKTKYLQMLDTLGLFRMIENEKRYPTPSRNSRFLVGNQSAIPQSKIINNHNPMMSSNSGKDQNTVQVNNMANQIFKPSQLNPYQRI